MPYKPVQNPSAGFSLRISENPTDNHSFLHYFLRFPAAFASYSPGIVGYISGIESQTAQVAVRIRYPVAAAYAAKGFHAFVLHYSVQYAASGYAPMKELDWAITLLREKAEEWNIAENKIFTCGFSAGGHLAMSQGLFGKNRPAGLILGYPAVQLKGEAAFLIQLLAGKEQLEAEDLKYADLPAQVTAQAPPLFVFTTAEDTLTYGASLALAGAYAANGLPCELHIFQKGPHGYALANAASADGAVSNLNPQAE